MRGEFMKVVVSAGGTGGHIYPALAILEKLKKEVGNLEVLYIGTKIVWKVKSFLKEE